MSEIEVDALVVGAGPGGLYAAGCLARAGHEVLVCEEHHTIGEPVHCTGILADASFKEFDLPRRTILNGVDTLRLVSPSGLSVDYTTDRPEAVVIDRARFDRALADRAQAAGAQVWTGVRVHGLHAANDGVRAEVGSNRVRARLAVLACGASYRLQRHAGFGLPAKYLQTAQCELPARIPGRVVEIHFGRDVAPGGFAWAVPVVRPDGHYVRIGVMTSRDARLCFGRIVERSADSWGLQPERVTPRLKVLPLGAIQRTYGTRLLAVGDAAGLVKPTTGGGIYYSILSASIAASVGARALSRDRLDATALSAYESRWRSRLGRELEAQHALRGAAVAMSDRDIDALFDLAQTDGVMPLVRRTARFNEHRHLIQALFKHREARQILFRSLRAQLVGV